MGLPFPSHCNYRASNTTATSCSTGKILSDPWDLISPVGKKKIMSIHNIISHSTKPAETRSLSTPSSPPLLSPLTSCPTIDSGKQLKERHKRLMRRGEMEQRRKRVWWSSEFPVCWRRERFETRRKEGMIGMYDRTCPNNFWGNGRTKAERGLAV